MTIMANWAASDFLNARSFVIKFSPTGEDFEVKLGEFGTFMSILVYDKWPRISVKFKLYIFNRFSQVNITTSSTITVLERSIRNIIVIVHQGCTHFDKKMD